MVAMDVFDEGFHLLSSGQAANLALVSGAKYYIRIRHSTPAQFREATYTLSIGAGVLPALSFDQGSYSMTIPGSNTATITVAATAYDSDGVTPVPGAIITYSLATAYVGVSINSATGAVTVASTALPGPVTLKAEYNGIEAAVDLILTKSTGTHEYGAIYIYDALGRLIRAEYESGKIAIYQYDANGNMTAVSVKDAI
jgi:YD repeat-containing protein